MSGAVRIALVGGACVLAASSAATLRTAASPLLQGPALSMTHQADQEAARRAKPISGQNTFRFDTFDDEQLWTNVLRMHEAIPSVNPVTALAVWVESLGATEGRSRRIPQIPLMHVDVGMRLKRRMA
jgi:hypothetical protein